MSRWRLGLPHAGLPVTRLVCETSTALFERQLRLYEERSTERGEHFRYELGREDWRRTPGGSARFLVLAVTDRPQTDTLWLETDNGDNPPLQLTRFRALHAIHRVLFKTTETNEVWLYYGKPTASAPRYDLGLVADQLLSADRSTGRPGAEQRLQKATWREQFGEGGRGGPLIWGVLVLVAVSLLWVVRRLLPSAAG